MMNALYLVLCLGLVYSSFCRSVRMTKANTIRPVRWAFQSLIAAATTALFAPFLWAYKPDWVTVMLLAAFVWVQWITARHWRYGVPPSFRPEA